MQAFIADGELGTVYKARDTTQDEGELALKVIHPQLCRDEKYLERFRKAARKTVQLPEHLNILNILDVEHDHGTNYLVMEYFPSSNLRDHTRIHGKLRIQDATQIIRQISEALIQSHSHDLLHCDIKPANILLDNHQQVKVTDFGITASVNDEFLPSTRQIFGTLTYMSPEQTRSEALNGQTDLFSLGLVFYELITGQNLWNNIPQSIIYNSLQTVNSLPALDFPVDVPLDIQDVIQDLLRFAPADRIRDAQTLLTRLTELGPQLSSIPMRQQIEDSDTTILLRHTEKPKEAEDDTTEKISPTLNLPSSTPTPPSKKAVKEHEDPAPTKQPLTYDPAEKAKDPAKPYYFADDSQSFKKYREEVEEKKLLFASQISSKMMKTSTFFSPGKITITLGLLRSYWCFSLLESNGVYVITARLHRHDDRRIRQATKPESKNIRIV